MYNLFTNSTSHLSAYLLILTQQLLRQTKLLKVFSKVLNTQVAYVAYRSYSSCNIPCNSSELEFSFAHLFSFQFSLLAITLFPLKCAEVANWGSGIK